MKKLILLFGCLLICIGKTYPRPNGTFKYPTLEEKIEKADAILEGEVIATRGFENDERTAIYTSATIKISKIFKGKISDSTIELVFEGGTFEGKRQILTHSFSIDKGHDGLFFLKVNSNTAVLGSRTNSYIILMGTSGYIQYHHDPVNHPATCPGTFYTDLEKELFEPIEAVTGIHRNILGPNMFEIKAANSSSPAR